MAVLAGETLHDASSFPALGADDARHAAAIVAWLLRTAREIEPDDLMEALAARLRYAGLPVDRIVAAVESAHSVHIGFQRVWSDTHGSTSDRFPYGEQATAAYLRSPFAAVHRTGRWLALDLPQALNDHYNVADDLRSAGYRHYLCVPIAFPDGRLNGLTLATRGARGYSPAQLAILAAIMPAFGILLELVVERWRKRMLLRTYVGRTPADRIISGAVRGGEVSRIEAAILFADMRGFTSRTLDLTPEQTVDLLDAFHDCLVPAIRRNGGEILKFMGDGLLAAFAIDPSLPRQCADPGNDLTGSSPTALDAVRGALDASLAALRFVDALDHPTGPMKAGIALHMGEVAYGNVGSEDRLDFTVVGRDVNLASRIARLNKDLDEPILMSGEFVTTGRLENVRGAGSHQLRGLPQPVTVHAPR